MDPPNNVVSFVSKKQVGVVQKPPEPPSFDQTKMRVELREDGAKVVMMLYAPGEKGSKEARAFAEIAGSIARKLDGLGMRYELRHHSLRKETGAEKIIDSIAFALQR